MKLKSINIYYLAGLLPPVAYFNFLLLYVTYGNKWMFYPSLLVIVYIDFILIRKFYFLPRPKKEYQRLEQISLELPVNYGVNFYTCDSLSKFSFLLRVVEVLSPIVWKTGEHIKVVINKELLKTEGEKFIKIAAIRELERYRTKAHLKILLGLVWPNFLLAVVLTYLFLLHRDSFLEGNVFFIQFAVPFLFVVLFSSWLFIWNCSVSRMEQKLDRFLTSYYSVEDVVGYVHRIEELEMGYDKQKYKEFNGYYARKRIQKLKTLK